MLGSIIDLSQGFVVPVNSQDEIQTLELPELRYGPINVKIGVVVCVLKSSEIVNARLIGETYISARVKEPTFELPSGEKILVTTRKKISKPDNIDGVLFQDVDGSLKWLEHKVINEIEASASSQGWPTIVEKRSLEWDGKFNFKTEKPNADGTVDENNRGLRPPQIGALYAIGAHWSLSNQAATIVMPTGTGKTETMLSALAQYVRKPMLVVVPSDPLRSQTARKFVQFGLLKELGVLAKDTINPIVGVITKIPKSAEDLEIFSRCNVIIATMDALAASAAEQFVPQIVDQVGVLVIDEAHHIGATRWSKFREAFLEKPVLQFTATPYRRDGKVVDGQVIFNYPLKRAQLDGYFKPITFEPVYESVPSKADLAIAETAVSRLRADLQENLNHLMMARCGDIKRAEEVFKIYQKLAPDLAPVLVYSELPDVDKRIEALRAGKNRIAVCVKMLGEGFDLPELKIAAIHDLHKSLAVLMQFTGRFTRSSGQRIGNATVVANIAEPNVSGALERLYSEDADWNEVLSELSSKAAQEHAKLIDFLNEAYRLDKAPDDDDTAISHKLLLPTLSTLFYEANSFSPKNFHEGLPNTLKPYRVWLHSGSSTLFFVTRSQPAVSWMRSKSVHDQEWTLFILHYDEKRGLLYLTCSDKKTNFDGLAYAVGATKPIRGDLIFRAMGRITRLIFQNVGVKKHGRRNLSYASYTGAEVVSALGLAEKSGSVKALLSGTGWEGGRQITIGCSIKGRVWSRDKGTIPQLNDWCEIVGDKLRDDTIKTSKLIDNVLLPTEVSELPRIELLGIEWPVEILRISEERVVFSNKTQEISQTTFELSLVGANFSANSIDFELIEAQTGVWGQFRFTLGGEAGFKVIQTAGAEVVVTIGKISATLADYFSDYPPLFRFVDLTELDANLHIVPQTPYEFVITDDKFEVWEWPSVDLTKESIWKDGETRTDSIQWHAAQHYIDAGFDIVFDDDASGEAADLVCMKIEEDHIRLDLVHCKFSGGAKPGERVRDVVEVSSQAIRSGRWVGKFTQLCSHLKTRDDNLSTPQRPTRFLKGNAGLVNAIQKSSRFKPVKANVVIVQPGLSKAARTQDQSIVLAAAMTYLKETVNIDIGVICSV